MTNAMESRIGLPAGTAVRHAAKVRVAIRLGWLVGLPMVLIGSVTIPGVRDFATIPIACWFLAGVVGIIVSERWWAGQQRVAQLVARRYPSRFTATARCTSRPSAASSTDAPSA